MQCGFLGVTFREKKNNFLAENQISFLCGNVPDVSQKAKRLCTEIISYKSPFKKETQDLENYFYKIDWRLDTSTDRPLRAERITLISIVVIILASGTGNDLIKQIYTSVLFNGRIA